MMTGDLSAFRFRHQVRVRNYEIDWQGIVHNATYLLFFETGRVAYLEQLGIPVDIHAIQHESKVVVVRNEIDYRSPARFGEVLDVFTRIAFVRSSSFGFEGIMQEAVTGRRIAENVSIHVWLDHRTDRPMPVPAAFRRKVMEFEGDNGDFRDPGEGA
jgi:acyl-CoA thioester hydrolase